jgi:TRAP-type C4-dicarboxylate transport system permease large subunit
MWVMGFVPLDCPLGLVHPLIGSVQFVGRAIGDVSIGETSKTAPPYYVAIFSAIDIATRFPPFSTWLPSSIAGIPCIDVAASSSEDAKRP